MNKRPVSVDDLYAIRRIDETTASPGSTSVAFTVTVMDRESDAYLSRLWLLYIETGELRQLTHGDVRDQRPRWSPNGESIAFLSRRGGEDASNQIHLVPVGGGEPRQVSNHCRGISDFAWSPDGQRIVFVADHVAHSETHDTDVRVIATARYRFDGLGYLDGAFKQLFILDVESGTIRQLTDGPFDHIQPAWSPNGSEIVCVSSRRPGWEFSSLRDLYLVKAESGSMRQLTSGDGRWTQPSWSPDGRHIATYGTKNLQSATARNEVCVLALASGELRSLTAELDIDFRDSSISDWNGFRQGPAEWLDDDRLLAVASRSGDVLPVVVSLQSGDHLILGQSTGHYGSPHGLADGRILAARSNFTDPGEIVILDPAGAETVVTSFNHEWRQAVQLVEPERLEVVSADGESIGAWLMRPDMAEHGEKLPLLLEIHGGPFGMYANSFMHEFQLLAGRGFGVVFANPRGSSGYGDRFAGLLLPEVGANDLPDLLAVVDAAVSSGWVDESRLGVLGGSYGGFMTNWVVAHTDHFRAAVTQRTISDWYSTWGTDDIFFSDGNLTFGATPWEDPELYFRISPLTYVEQMTTPMLIVHSEEDYRCPISQGEQLYTALKRLGRTVEFVRVPDESHGLSRSGKPCHRTERLQHIIRWFETHLQMSGPASPAG